MIPQFVDMLDLNIVGGSGATGFGLGGFGQGGFGEGAPDSFASGYKYSSYEDPRIAAYVAKILPPGLSISKVLPDPLTQRQNASGSGKTAIVPLSNIHRSTTEGQTISYVQSAYEVEGATGLARIRNLATGSDFLWLAGVISRIPDLSQDRATIEITADDVDAMAMDFPKALATDFFPSLDQGTVRASTYPVVVALGPFRKANLGLCLAASMATCSFTMIGAESDKFTYLAITGMTATAIVAGDVLAYDVQLDSTGVRIGVDLRCTDVGSTRLRAVGALDQNGKDAHPGTDLSDRAVGKFYRRKIPLDLLAGKTVASTGFMIACETDTNGTWTGRIANIQILDSQGNLKRSILDGTKPTIAVTVDSRSNAGNTGTVTKDNGYYYGPIRLNTSGLLSIPSVYRAAAIVPTSEYSIVDMFGFRLLRFAVDPRQTGGSGVKVYADILSTEFTNPGKAIPWALSDPIYGAGLPVSDSSWATVVSDYVSLGYGSALGWGFDAQRKLRDFIDEVALHGLSIDKDQSGYYVGQVDLVGLHTTAAINLGQGDANGLQNLTVINATPVPMQQRIKKLILLGIYDSQDGSESWLARTSRSRSSKGIEKTIKNNFIANADVLDRECHWLFHTMTGMDWRVEGEVLLKDALSLPLNLVTKVYIPNQFYAGRDMMVRGVSYTRGKVKLSLAGYVATAYSYTKGTDIHVDPSAYTIQDYRGTFPTAPSNLSIVSKTTRVNVTTGQVEAVYNCTVDAPTFNVSDIEAQLLPVGIPYPTDIQTLNLASVGFSTAIPVQLVGLPGAYYDLRFISINYNNRREAQRGQVAQLLNQQAALNTTPPAAPTISGIVTGPGALANVALAKNAEADIKYYEISRSRDDQSANLTSAHIIGYAAHVGIPSLTDAKFTDADLGVPLFYYARAINSSDTPSAFSAPFPITVTKVATLDVAANATSFIVKSNNSGLTTVNTTEKVVGSITHSGILGQIEFDINFSIENEGTQKSTLTVRIRRNSLAGETVGSKSRTLLPNVGGEEDLVLKELDDAYPAGFDGSYVVTVRATGGDMRLLNRQVISRNNRR